MYKCPKCSNTTVFEVVYTILGYINHENPDIPDFTLDTDSIEVCCGGGEITCKKCEHQGSEDDFETKIA